MSFFQELKRRNVFKVAIAYIVVAWLVAQVLQLVFESFGTPVWVMKTVLVLMAMGMVFALFFAWAFELTPEGLKRENEVDRTESITPQTGKKLNNTIFLVMALAIAYFAYDKFVQNSNQPVLPVEVISPAGTEQITEQAASKSGKSVAVLPFVDMSPEKDQEYFTDGLTENLLNALAQLRELKVAGRTSSFAFKNRNEDLRSIGTQLGVAHILEGSVQKSGERVRITAQLINAGDGYHLWSQTYDRTLKDVFAVQDEIAAEVARAMEITLLGQDNPVADAKPVAESSGAAYNDYLKGLFERNRGNLESNQRAMTYFQRALDVDPDMALAWAELSMSRSYVAGYDNEDFTPGFEEARTYALRALEIDPDLPEAYLALASIQQAFDWDWTAAEASYNKAISLRPGDASIRRSHARLLGALGNIDRAQSELEQVIQLDPLDLSAQQSLADTYSRQGRYDDAFRIYDHLKEIDPNRTALFWGRAMTQFRQGLYEEALQELSQETFEFLKLTGEAITYHHLNQKNQAEKALKTLIDTMGESSSYQIAEIYAQWGDFDRAMQWLERGYEIRDPGLQYLASDDLVTPMYDDPRFLAFLRKMNLEIQPRQ